MTHLESGMAMIGNNKLKRARLMLGGALLAATALAQAQFVWLDEKGIKHFSDRPPGPSVPLKRILKAPGLAAQQLEAAHAAASAEPAASAESGASAATAAASTASASAKAPPTLAERNAEFAKRRNEETDKGRKAEEDARRQTEAASNCESHRKNKALLESGARIGTVEANGQRGFVSDEARARQLLATQRALINCK